MQITGQNNQTPAVPQPQYNSSYNCGAAAPANGAAQAQPAVQTQPVPAQQPPAQTYYYPGQTQSCPIPGTSAGVNIQIFNPMVTTPGAHTNVNSPCYPPGYYTGPIGPQQPAPVPTPTAQPPQGQPTAQTPAQTPTQAPVQEQAPKTETEEKKKTEKRKIVVLTDDYIRNLENGLNSQDKSIRLNAAKAVFARLKEDESRKDDKALNALVNKMLQDPAEDIRFLALTALDSRMVSGDDYTVNLLKNMQNSKKGFGQEAVDANSILLKMSGQQAEKEFEVKDSKEKPKKNPLYDVK